MTETVDVLLALQSQTTRVDNNHGRIIQTGKTSTNHL